VLHLMEHETLSRDAVLRIFAPVHKRPTRGSYTGYGKRLPSDRPPVLTPKELALIAASDGKELPSSGNGQAPSGPDLPDFGRPFGMPPETGDDNAGGPL
jgi:cell division protease FtsH